MMIFDGFKRLYDAEEFARAVTEQTAGTAAIICQSQEEFEKHDIFPWELQYPVVLVPRLDDIEEESEIESLVTEFNGEFAGT